MGYISPELQVANLQLKAMQQAAQAARASADHPPQTLSSLSCNATTPLCAAGTAVPSSAVPAISPQLRNANEFLERLRRAKKSPSRPQTGWLDMMSQRQAAAAAPPALTSSQAQPTAAAGIKLYPSLITALEQGQAAQLRLWLALRHLDPRGRGWLRLAAIKDQLLDLMDVKTWRRLRQILGGGDGVWWERCGERIWLRGAARVAAGLGLARLDGRPIALPVQALSNIGEFKAAVYAAWHGGRKSENPISRQAIKELTGIPERTQRHYDRLSGTKRITNYATGERNNEQTAERAAWEHGRAAFVLTDYKGKQGRKGGRYNAWRLPNSYQIKLERANKGRQRKINAKLAADLVTNGARGNGGSGIDRLFHPDGKQAARAAQRQPGQDAFWPTFQGKAGQHWGVLRTQPPEGKLC